MPCSRPSWPSLAVAAAGCGGSAVAVPELTSLTQVAQKSSAADSARFALTLDMTIPVADQKLSFSAEGGFDTPARRAQLTFDLSSFAELFKSLGSSLGGTVTGDLGSPEDWKLEAIQDGDTVVHPLPADREAAAGRQDVDQGRREGPLQRRRRPAEPVRLARRHRPARRLRDPEGRLGLDRGGRQRGDPRRRDEPLPGHDRHGEARAARPGRAAAEPRRDRPGREAGRADASFRSTSGSTPTSGCASSRSTSTRSSPAPMPR